MFVFSSRDFFFYIMLTAPLLAPGTHLLNHPEQGNTGWQPGQCTVTLASRWRHLSSLAASRLTWILDNKTFDMLSGIKMKSSYEILLKKDKPPRTPQSPTISSTWTKRHLQPLSSFPPWEAHTHLREYLECLMWKGSIGLTNVSCKSIKEATHQKSTPCTERSSIC